MMQEARRKEEDDEYLQTIYNSKHYKTILFNT
jgi:hypothetical protein